MHGWIDRYDRYDKCDRIDMKDRYDRYSYMLDIIEMMDRYDRWIDYSYPSFSVSVVFSFNWLHHGTEWHRMNENTTETEKDG